MSQNRYLSDVTYAGDSAFTFDFKAIPRKRKRETLVIIFLAFIGFFGFIYVLNCTEKNPVETMQYNKILYSNIPALQTKKSGTPKLDIAGTLKPAAQLKFTFTNLRDNQDYVIDFGDGIQKGLKSATVTHQYQNQGNYFLTLEKLMAGTGTTVLTKEISIK